MKTKVSLCWFGGEASRPPLVEAERNERPGRAPGKRRERTSGCRRRSVINRRRLNPEEPRKRPTSRRKPTQRAAGTRKPRQPSKSRSTPSGQPAKSRPTASRRPANRQELVKRLREPRVAALLGVGIAVIVVAILLISGGGNDENNNTSAASGNGGGTASGATKPIEASADRLSELAGVVGHPVYWAGARPGKKYELTVDNSQNIYIRYLDPGVPIGSKDVSALTVGTYPVQNATAALRGQADKPGATTESAPGGGFVLTSADAPQSAYIAYPNSDYQIEVYDPVPGRALNLATSGGIVPIK
jgi:hypothetical protein